MSLNLLEKFMIHISKAVRPWSSQAVIDLTKAYRAYFKVQKGFVLTELAEQMNFTEINKAEWDSPVTEEELEKARKELEKIFIATVWATATRGAQQFLKDLSIWADFWVSDLIAVQYAKDRAGEMITKIDETTRKQVNKIIVDSLEEGLDFNQVAKLINKKFASFSKTRAKFIAVNEIGNAYEVWKIKQAEDYSQRSWNQMLKKWVTQWDWLVTALCHKNSSDWFIKIEQPFSSWDDRPLRFPWCRCFTKYKSETALALQ